MNVSYLIQMLLSIKNDDGATSNNTQYPRRYIVLQSVFASLSSASVNAIMKRCLCINSLTTLRATASTNIKRSCALLHYRKQFC